MDVLGGGEVVWCDDAGWRVLAGITAPVPGCLNPGTYRNPKQLALNPNHDAGRLPLQKQQTVGMCSIGPPLRSPNP